MIWLVMLRVGRVSVAIRKLVQLSWYGLAVETQLGVANRSRFDCYSLARTGSAIQRQLNDVGPRQQGRSNVRINVLSSYVGR
jgi:hypothetical protein